MSIIYVDQLAVRLPSDARNTFNPSYAFNGASGRTLGQVMGLREVQSGHILLPMDAEGSIVVTPGQHYAVVIVRETKSTAASVASDGAATAAGNSGEGNKKNRGQHPGKQQQYQNAQQPQKQNQKPPQQQTQNQPSPRSDAAPDAKPNHNQSQPEPHQKDGLAKQERKTARAALVTAPAELQHVAEAKPVENAPYPAAQSEQPSKKKRHERDAREAAPSQQQHRNGPSKASSPPATVTTHPSPTDGEDSNDVPLMQAYAAPLSLPSSRTSQATAAAASSKNSSKRGSPSTRPETAVAPPPPIPVRPARSSSTSNGSDSDKDDHDKGSKPFSQLYGALASAPVAEEPAPAKKRRAQPEKKAPKVAVPSPQQQPATAAVTTPKHSPKQQHQKHKESPETVPVTLPPSGRSSTLRRAPLDTSSDSDSD
ncbi:hypothetical protein ABL78_5499 [Leptomonas seymouri]|uniref:Uncharacterized protein n=1 Tax=Leptomonas seymouri TaxID=5684 RepID=A0A0N1HWS2_LEPSE|nr:hypothetical protein ABL78_5499 [Leptomonas seymouri]|eukprot:KPI85445.1 hypothetical protein ABL78_5499 [Leptomonas seymouri]